MLQIYLDTQAADPGRPPLDPSRPAKDPYSLPFFYGIHYRCGSSGHWQRGSPDAPTDRSARLCSLLCSTPGYVMYWLVRSSPAHMLRLQGGKFDSPDRLFHSLPECWSSASSSRTDVKELTPEFFMADPTFLLNHKDLHLGKLAGDGGGERAG